MSLKIENKKDKSMLTIDGELTIYTAQEYRNCLIEDFIADGMVEVDLQNVEEIDTCGLQLLAAMSKKVSDNGGEMNIIATSEVAKNALDTSRLMTDMTFTSGVAT